MWDYLFFGATEYHGFPHTWYYSVGFVPSNLIKGCQKAILQFMLEIRWDGSGFQYHVLEPTFNYFKNNLVKQKNNLDMFIQWVV